MATRKEIKARQAAVASVIAKHPKWSNGRIAKELTQKHGIPATRWSVSTDRGKVAPYTVKGKTRVVQIMGRQQHVKEIAAAHPDWSVARIARELKNKHNIQVDRRTIAADIKAVAPDKPAAAPPATKATDAQIRRAFTESGGNVSQTAKRAGISRSAAQERIKKLFSKTYGVEEK